MRTFVASGRDKKPPRSHLVCFVVALFCLLSTSCGHEILQDTKSEERLSSARLSGEPVFSTTYEVEEYTATQILSKFSPDSKNRAFEEIAAQPRLDRQRIEFKLFADGNYELRAG
ncbi:hypothetical protein [Dyadobacter sp. CY343]|uniref:hypothetical protein n=1 Tax=Dyadobacter sp. CY343 TaxID=2907299 RepID=UPI001F21DDAC|nr:hypothetical protein [Dyadobacter sp. CY343]MCE7062374.1 hypothetical protein [Dyadobacter sp. CY343]